MALVCPAAGDLSRRCECVVEQCASLSLRSSHPARSEHVDSAPNSALGPLPSLCGCCQMTSQITDRGELTVVRRLRENSPRSLGYHLRCVGGDL